MYDTTEWAVIAEWDESAVDYYDSKEKAEKAAEWYDSQVEQPHSVEERTV